MTIAVILTACQVGAPPTESVNLQATNASLKTLVAQLATPTPDLQATVDAAVEKAMAELQPEVPATATPESTAVTLISAPIGSNVTITCNGTTLQVPVNGQVFPSTTWVNNQPQHNECYDVVYDPDQSGVSYLPAKGWWYQPLLPGPHREYHEVVLVLQAGTYKFVGPECTAYHNFDTKHDLKDGNILVNRQNVEELVVPKTTGAPKQESWIFVTCQESDASGFSFALR